MPAAFAEGVCARDGSSETGSDGAAEGAGCLHDSGTDISICKDSWSARTPDRTSTDSYCQGRSNLRRILILYFLNTDFVRRSCSIRGIVLALQTLGGGLDGCAGRGSVGGRHCCLRKELGLSGVKMVSVRGFRCCNSQKVLQVEVTSSLNAVRWGQVVTG